MPRLSYPFRLYPAGMMLFTILLLTACQKNDAPEPSQTQQQSNQPARDIIGQLEQQRIQTFPATPNDAQDIAQLEEYERRHSEITEEMEVELAEMREAGTLTEDFEQQRQLDNIYSALDLLKAMELKTEQGRYIQGLYAQYWEKQAQLLAAGNTSSDVDSLAGYLQAQSQLKYWKNQN